MLSNMSILFLVALFLCIFVANEVVGQYLPYYGNGLGYGYNAYAFGSPYPIVYGKREAGFGPSNANQ